MTGHLFIFRGIPASGKSSIARAMLDAGLLDLVVTRDDIRQELCPGRKFIDRDKMTQSDRDFESLVLRTRNDRIMEGLRENLRVASADTNVSGTAMRELHEIARSEGVSVTVITVDVPTNVCVLRDLRRDVPVGEQVIRRMASDWAWQRQ